MYHHTFFQGKGKLLKLPQLIDMSAQVIFVSTQKLYKVQINISLIHKGQIFNFMIRLPVEWPI